MFAKCKKRTWPPSAWPTKSQLTRSVRSLLTALEATAALAKLGIRPVRGTLDDTEVLAKAALDSDVTVNTANAGHRAAAEAMLKALANTGKTFLHTDGSSIIGTRACGGVCR